MLVTQQVVQAALNHVSQLRRLHGFKGLSFLNLEAFGWPGPVSNN